jgi:hypothetical protein
MNWFQLVHFIRFLHTEQQIEQQTYEDMMDALQSFKNYAYDVDDEERKKYMVKEGNENE